MLNLPFFQLPLVAIFSVFMIMEYNDILNSKTAEKNMVCIILYYVRLFSAYTELLNKNILYKNWYWVTPYQLTRNLALRKFIFDTKDWMKSIFLTCIFLFFLPVTLLLPLHKRNLSCILLLQNCIIFLNEEMFSGLLTYYDIFSL